MTAKRAPEAPAGLEWVVMEAGRTLARPSLQTTTPCGRARSAVWSLSPGRTRLLANKGEIPPYFLES